MDITEPIYLNDIDEIKVILKENILFNDDQIYEAYKYCICYNRLEIFKLFLNDSQFDPCVINNQVLNCAIINQKIEYIKLLLLDKRIFPKDYIIDLISSLDYLEVINRKLFKKEIIQLIINHPNTNIEYIKSVINCNIINRHTQKMVNKLIYQVIMNKRNELINNLLK